MYAIIEVGGKQYKAAKEDVIDLEIVRKTRELPLFGAPGVNRSLVDLYFPE